MPACLSPSAATVLLVHASIRWNGIADTTMLWEKPYVSDGVGSYSASRRQTFKPRTISLTDKAVDSRPRVPGFDSRRRLRSGTYLETG